MIEPDLADLVYDDSEARVDTAMYSNLVLVTLCSQMHGAILNRQEGL